MPEANRVQMQEEGQEASTAKFLLIITHANMARRAVPWLAQTSRIRNADLLVAPCVLNPVAVPGRKHAWPLIENPRKVRRVLKETIDALPDGSSVELLEEISGVSPSEEVINVVRKHGIKIIHFPVDARFDPSVPDMQFGQRLLHDAPCDVVMTDIGATERTSIKRIVIPMDIATSGCIARYICEVGNAYGVDVVPLHISADFGADSQTIAKHELDLQLGEAGIETEYSWLVPQVTIAEGFHQGLMQSINAHDAVLMGSSSVKLLHDIRREIMRIRPQDSEAIAVGVLRPAGLAAKSRAGLFVKRIKAALPELTLADRVSLFDRIQRGARLTPDFTIMIGLSVLMASFGLLADNSSVVIGAMLVAPFMTSLIGIGLALVQGNLRLMKRSAMAMGVGLLIGFLLSFLLGLFVPLDELPLEVLARGDPNIVDMIIAFVSGMAAAYAVSRESVAESIVGVAIAAALVPPLSCIGITLAHGHILEAEGASILLITNLAAIVLGAAFMFRRLGVPGTRTELRSYVLARRVSITLVLLLLVLSLPLGFRMAKQLAVGQTRPMGFRVSSGVKQSVHNLVDRREGLNLVFMGRSGSGHSKRVRIILSTDNPVPASVVEKIRTAVQAVQGKDTPVEINVFQNAVLSTARISTKLDANDVSVRN